MSVDGVNGAVFQMFAHGIMTALFFSAVGYIYDRTHTKEIGELGGLSRVMPVGSSFFIVAAFSGMGIPCLASFWGELMVFIASFRVFPVRGGLAIAALVISALFMLRVVQKTFYGPTPEKYAHLTDASLFLNLPRIILVAVIVLFGLMPSLLFEVIQTASEPLIAGLLK
jgi:NADH-quinone oxidoreductase subunit M